MELVIFHNPACGTSRRTLELIREAGLEPRVVEYLKTPPSRDELADLARRAGGARTLLREKEPLCVELGLLEPDVDDDAILAAIAAHSRLLNRPVVASARGVRACRPAELVLDLLDPAG